MNQTLTSEQAAAVTPPRSLGTRRYQVHEHFFLVVEKLLPDLTGSIRGFIKSLRSAQISPRYEEIPQVPSTEESSNYNPRRTSSPALGHKPLKFQAACLHIGTAAQKSGQVDSTTRNLTVEAWRALLFLFFLPIRRRTKKKTKNKKTKK